VQKENYFSAATNVAYLSDPDFNGFSKYDRQDDGIPITKGVEVFASGERNPFGICLHSNGYLYGTDNGPNIGYGKMKQGCGDNEWINDVETEDKGMTKCSSQSLALLCGSFTLRLLQNVFLTMFTPILRYLQLILSQRELTLDSTSNDIITCFDGNTVTCLLMTHSFFCCSPNPI